MITDKRISLGLLPWRRRDLPVTASPEGAPLVVITHPPGTPKAEALLTAILHRVGFHLASTPILAPNAPLPPEARATLILGDHPNPSSAPAFTLPTLEHLISNPLEKRQAERILRDCQRALSIP